MRVIIPEKMLQLCGGADSINDINPILGTHVNHHNNGL